VTDGRVVGPDDRRCPVSLALCAGAYWLVPRVRPSRSVRRLPGPFPVVVAPVSTSHRVSLPTLRRVLVPFTARSSWCRGRMAGHAAGVKRLVGRWPMPPAGAARNPRTAGPGAPDSAGTAGPSESVRTTRTCCASTGRPWR